MRKLLIVLAVLALATTTFAAGKAAPKEMGMGAGAFLSYWDAKDADDPGIGLGVKAGMELMPNVTVEGRATLYSFDGSEEEADWTLGVIPLEVGGIYTYALADQINVYGGAGVGYYLATIDVDTSSSVEALGGEVDAEVENGLGFYILGGGSFALADNISVFGEVKYTSLKVDVDPEVKVGGVDVPVEDDEIDLSGLALNIGAAIKF